MVWVHVACNPSRQQADLEQRCMCRASACQVYLHGSAGHAADGAAALKGCQPFSPSAAIKHLHPSAAACNDGFLRKMSATQPSVNLRGQGSWMQSHTDRPAASIPAGLGMHLHWLYINPATARDGPGAVQVAKRVCHRPRGQAPHLPAQGQGHPTHYSAGAVQAPEHQQGCLSSISAAAQGPCAWMSKRAQCYLPGCLCNVLGAACNPELGV